MIVVGGETQYTFSFDYLKKSFIKLRYLDATNAATELVYRQDYTIDNKTVTIADAKKGDATGRFLIYRETSTDSIVTFVDASILLADNLNTKDIQELHLIEENKDYVELNSLALVDNSYWNAQLSPIRNVGNPVNDTDAVNKRSLGTYLTDAQAAATAAQTSAVNAQNAANSSNSSAIQSQQFATAAQTSANNSSTSATNSATSATASDAQRALAKAWAMSDSSPDGASDNQSSTGLTMSAKQWALFAKQVAMPLASDPVGSGKVFFGSVAPAGFLLCQGQAVSRSTYAALFGVIGTTYGVGNGSTTFNLPDARTRSIIGLGGVATPLGLTGGEVSHVLTVNEMPSHAHSASAQTDTQGQHQHNIQTHLTQAAGSGPYVAGGTNSGYLNGQASDAAGSHSHNVGVTVNANGSGAAHNNMPPFLVANWIIKY